MTAMTAVCFHGRTYSGIGPASLGGVFILTFLYSHRYLRLCVVSSCLGWQLVAATMKSSFSKPIPDARSDLNGFCSETPQLLD